MRGAVTIALSYNQVNCYYFKSKTLLNIVLGQILTCAFTCSLQILTRKKRQSLH
jgi:hypothetical protein